MTKNTKENIVACIIFFFIPLLLFVNGLTMTIISKQEYKDLKDEYNQIWAGSTDEHKEIRDEWFEDWEDETRLIVEDRPTFQSYVKERHKAENFLAYRRANIFSVFGALTLSFGGLVLIFSIGAYIHFWMQE